MNVELYTNEGWIKFDLDKGVVSDHLCCTPKCGLPAETIINQGSERRPILWAICGGCAEECGAANQDAEYMAERE